MSLVICWIIFLIHQVAGRSTGPPNTACADITPQHSSNSPSTCPQPCPYSLQVTAINGVPVGPLTGRVAYRSSSDMFQSTFNRFCVCDLLRESPTHLYNFNLDNSH